MSRERMRSATTRAEQVHSSKKREVGNQDGEMNGEIIYRRAVPWCRKEKSF